MLAFLIPAGAAPVGTDMHVRATPVIRGQSIYEIFP